MGNRARTTAAIYATTASKAHRVGHVLAQESGRLPSMAEILDRAMDALMAELREQGHRIPRGLPPLPRGARKKIRSADPDADSRG